MTLFRGIQLTIAILILFGFPYLVYQEYVPEYDEVTSKLIWEEVERLNYVPEVGVPTT